MFCASIRQIVLLFLCSLFVHASTGHGYGQRPNIVILYADDMGFGDLAAQNLESKIPTPHLDRLAADGTRFTDAHSSSGICTPSRYALLQGRYHWRKFHGIVNSFEQSVLDGPKSTIAELLQSNGYNTACIGKWHLGWDWKAIQREGSKPDPKKGYAADAFDWSLPIPDGPLAHGFDYYFGDDVPNFPPYAWIENDRVITIPTVPLATPKATAEGSWEARPGPSVEDWDFWGVMPKLTQRAEDWISKQSKDKPFFLYVPFTAPHAPIVPASEFIGTSQANGFGDFMSQTDASVGRILAALEEKGFSDNTWVIFSADNGPETYAYPRLKNYGHRSMGPLRGLKRDLYEGGHRVPMLMRWPGRIAKNRVCDGLLSQIDLFATIAKTLDLEIPEGSAEDSLDQSPMIFAAGESSRKSLVHNTNPNGYAIRQGNWVLIDAPTGSISKVPDWFNEQNGYSEDNLAGELYRLDVDLAQRENLFSSQPDRVEEMRSELMRIKQAGRE